MAISAPTLIGDIRGYSLPLYPLKQTSKCASGIKDDAMVAEVNMGGDMVRAVLAQARPATVAPSST
jgi:hypothetical protein